MYKLEKVEIEARMFFVDPITGHQVAFVARDGKEIDILRPYLDTQNYIIRALQAKKELSSTLARIRLEEKIDNFKEDLIKEIKRASEKTIPLPL